MMEKNVNQLIIDISINYGFFPLDISNCYEQNSEYIDNIIEVFQFRSEEDENVIETACEVLSNSFENFANSHKFETESTREQKLLVITAFLENVQFFSMCWNFMMIEKYKKTAAIIKSDWNSLYEKQLYNYQECLAAGSEGMKKFGKEHNVTGFGVLGQMCDNEDCEYQFYINLTEEASKKAFTVEIEFLNTDIKYTASIISSGDGSKLLHSDSIKVADIFSGIRNLIIKIIPTE